MDKWLKLSFFGWFLMLQYFIKYLNFECCIGISNVMLGSVGTESTYRKCPMALAGGGYENEMIISFLIVSQRSSYPTDMSWMNSKLTG